MKMGLDNKNAPENWTLFWMEIQEHVDQRSKCARLIA